MKRFNIDAAYYGYLASLALLLFGSVAYVRIRHIPTFNVPFPVLLSVAIVGGVSAGFIWRREHK